MVVKCAYLCQLVYRHTSRKRKRKRKQQQQQQQQQQLFLYFRGDVSKFDAKDICDMREVVSGFSDEDIAKLDKVKKESLYKKQLSLRHVYTGDFLLQFQARFRGKLLAIQFAAESTVLYTPQNCAWNRQCKRAIKEKCRKQN